MTIDLDAFEPDPARAAALDLRMRRELGESIAHVADRAAGAVEFDAGAISTLCDDLRRGEAYGPTAFGRYYELVAAVLEEDRAGAEAAFADLAAERPWATAPGATALDDPVLARGGVVRRRLGDDPPRRFLPPDPAVAAAFPERLDAGLALLDAGAPALAGEVRALVRHVALAVGDPTAPTQFDGGSAYQLWGLLLLNPSFHPTPVAMAEVVAHESAHSLLFGFTVDEPLVRNPDDALYASPLRRDPRPMDGVFHATFVSARMHWAMTRLAESGVLDAEDARAARAAGEADRVNFWAGHGVVAEHGELTTTGERLMAAARRHMEAEAPRAAA